MKTKILYFFIFSSLIIFGQFFFEHSTAQQKTGESPANIPASIENQPTIAETFNRLISDAEKSGAARVIIGVRAEFTPEGRLGESKLQAQRLSIKQSQKELLRRLDSYAVRDIKQFEYIPYLALEANAAALKQMQNDSLVFSIEEDEIGEPALAQSVSQIGAPAAWASGYTGSGQTVAIIDSGVDKNHSFLSGKVIAESCYSSNVSGMTTSFCPGGATVSTAPDSGLHCPADIAGCAHGTHLAGTAAGRGSGFSGVAKDANIISIQIYSKFETSAACGAIVPCARYFTSDLIRGLERVRTLAGTIDNIAAVDLSLQTGQKFTSNCDVSQSATKAAIDNLRSINIPTAACSGNFSFTDALTAPACISSAVSVGSVGDGSLGALTDSVVGTSDSSPLLHLLAPGQWITSSVPGGGFQNYTGTSMAAAHVTGAFAILKQRNPNATVGQMLNALINTGLPIVDSRNGIVKPRIRIDNAVKAVNNKVLFDYDGDDKADISVYRPSNGVWYLQNSTTGFSAVQFGISTDKIVPADYDGDGKDDIAVWRDGTWYLQRSAEGFVSAQFGNSGDVPQPADFDGDGRAELAVFRPSNGFWYVLNLANNQFDSVQFGSAEDKPVAADYDGDGKSDYAVYRPSNGVWYLLQTTKGFGAVQFGNSTDKPMIGDYDGDGKADEAVYRAESGTWFLLKSTEGFAAVQFGLSTDIPAAADFDGDGKTDIAVFRAEGGTWYQLKSSQGFGAVQFGADSDKPTSNAFVP